MLPTAALSHTHHRHPARCRRLSHHSDQPTPASCSPADALPVDRRPLRFFRLAQVCTSPTSILPYATQEHKVQILAGILGTTRENGRQQALCHVARARRVKICDVRFSHASHDNSIFLVSDPTLLRTRRPVSTLRYPRQLQSNQTKPSSDKGRCRAKSLRRSF
ncbi:hypothetical protein Cob_v000450 [Colletotrichum orbiculare MAFF 240422]|uniref:Uncharacterized protein n=1 Tax=Colletotrichum orbiculare (strain 104-T / ATCC 96160 / CBS 514.97 / LARS 414 / MAFF 240422) TaxID=1213857 RepID=A0A484G6W5_COLOR|nr:hypothetical protein Cob_v000450 [Colletotrichum orbiculare MAFF 240422]